MVLEGSIYGEYAGELGGGRFTVKIIVYVLEFGCDFISVFDKALDDVMGA